MKKTILILLFTILSTLTLSAQTRQEVLASKLAEHDMLYEMAQTKIALYEVRIEKCLTQIELFKKNFGKNADKLISDKNNDIKGLESCIRHYKTGLEELEVIKQSLTELENIEDENIFNEKLKKVEDDLFLTDFRVRRTVLGW